MITEVDERFCEETRKFDLRCTCDECAAFDRASEACAYGYPTEPHRRLPLAPPGEYVFCKAFELGP